MNYLDGIRVGIREKAIKDPIRYALGKVFSGVVLGATLVSGAGLIYLSTQYNNSSETHLEESVNKHNLPQDILSNDSV